ncbi:M50 family metallopeptidase [Myxococcota bacterium]|nr:M50 family metallopeptidase [Myxococcota bacterium]MBU1496325.1 M50 family metallopeptidase [Myxococcota bacterium]
MVLSKKIDTGFAFMKWPVGAAAGLLMIPALWAFGASVIKMIQRPGVSIPFGIGFGGYFVLWKLFFRSRSFGSVFSTFEHELTHALFAWLTLHRVTNLRVTWSSGGSVSFTPPGNWLIYLAPYFFPTITFMLLPFTLSGASSVFIAAVGVSASYHMTSTWIETHFSQTDIQQTGFLFSFLFLPTANFICYGVIISVLMEKGHGFGAYFSQLSYYASRVWSIIF